MCLGSAQSHCASIVADSAEATGLKWAAVAASGGMTLLSTTTLTGFELNISGIAGGYKRLIIQVVNAFGNNQGVSDDIEIRPNNVTFLATQVYNTSVTGWGQEASSRIWLSANAAGQGTNNNNSGNAYTLTIDNYASTDDLKPFYVFGGGVDGGGSMKQSASFGIINTRTAITSIQFNSNINFASGTVRIYGVN